MILAVKALHDNYRCVHGDIKPANFLGKLEHQSGAASADGQYALWRLADFGLTGPPDAATGILNGSLGTPAHSAPEVLEQHGSTFASDRYSLAVSLWELLNLRCRTCAPEPARNHTYSTYGSCVTHALWLISDLQTHGM